MTFEESIKIIKENMREGDAKLVSEQIRCTKPVVFSALQKTCLADMTMTEQRAFDSLLGLLTTRIESEKKTMETAIKLAESLSK